MHSENKKFKILATCHAGYVGVCTCCHEFNLAFNNLLLTFPEKDMLKYYRWLKEGVSDPKNKFEMKHNRNWVFKGPVENFYLAYNDQEVAAITTMIEEALLMMEVKKILKFE